MVLEAKQVLVMLIICSYQVVLITDIKETSLQLQQQIINSHILHGKVFSSLICP